MVGAGRPLVSAYQSVEAVQESRLAPVCPTPLRFLPGPAGEQLVVGRYEDYGAGVCPAL